MKKILAISLLSLMSFQAQAFECWVMLGCNDDAMCSTLRFAIEMEDKKVLSVRPKGTSETDIHSFEYKNDILKINGMMDSLYFYSEINLKNDQGYFQADLNKPVNVVCL